MALNPSSSSNLEQLTLKGLTANVCRLLKHYQFSFKVDWKIFLLIIYTNKRFRNYYYDHAMLGH